MLYNTQRSRKGLRANSSIPNLVTPGLHVWCEDENCCPGSKQSTPDIRLEYWDIAELSPLSTPAVSRSPSPFDLRDLNSLQVSRQVALYHDTATWNNLESVQLQYNG